MDEAKLKRTLRSVGMSCFINYFDLFSSDKFSNEDIVEYIFNENDFTEQSCISRTHHAKRIFRENKQIEALKIIESSTRVHPYTKLTAAKIRARLTLPPINIHKIPIIKKLMSFKAQDSKCRKLYCTTCGGLSSSIEKHIDSNLIIEIQEYFSNHSDDELYLLDDWYDFLVKYKYF